MSPFHRTLLFSLAFLLPGSLHAGWEKLFSTSSVHCFVAFDSVIVLGSDSGCYRSLDGGVTWSFHEVDRVLATATQTEVPLGVISLSRNTQYLFAATGVGIYSSNDTGRIWHPLGPFPDAKLLYLINVYAQDAVVLCTMAGGGLFRSTNNGTSWSYLGPHRQYDHIMRGPLLFAAAMDGIWCSPDSGLTWTQCKGFPSYRMALHLAGNADYMFADAYDLLYRSSDGGETWAVLETGMPFGGKHVEGIFASDSLLLVGLSEHEVYLSRDNGEHWINISAGIDTFGTDNSMSQFHRIGTRVLCTKDGSLWSYDLSQPTGVAPGRVKGPELFELWQNYPNPFNPLTMIKYTVGGTGPSTPSEQSAQSLRVPPQAAGGMETRGVSLVVYDALGRQVTTLVNEEKAPGTYDVHFDGSRLSSGVYYYRLTVGGFSETRKSVLLK